MNHSSDPVVRQSLMSSFQQSDPTANEEGSNNVAEHQSNQAFVLQFPQPFAYRESPETPPTQGGTSSFPVEKNEQVKPTGMSASGNTPLTSRVTFSSANKRTVASTFENAHNFSISGNPSFVNIGEHNSVKRVNVNHFSGTYGLDILKEFVSFDALHDSSAQDPERCCHPGTRECILKQMRHWIDNPDTIKRILWLHGPASVGKSAIAQTISYSYGGDKLVGTFFFFRSDPARNDGNRLFPTLAWQLAISMPEIKQYVINALNENPDLPRKAIEIQFERLIVRPFQALLKARPRLRTPMDAVVVVDGLDECLNEKLQCRFLKTIGNTVTDTHFPLRFLISSRPEAHIQETFDVFQTAIHCIDLAKTNEAYHDIEKYLRHEFTRIASENQLDALIWPGKRVVEHLIDQSSGQFIYASTIIKFVGDKYSSAVTQLDIIMGLEPTDGESPFANLDALYMEILQRQPHQGFLKDFLALLIGRRGVNSNIRSVPVVTPQGLYRDDPLLLNVTKNALDRKLRGMHSLLKFERQIDQIDVHHKSFPDFLQDPSRSSQYHISQQAGTRRYLELITETLVRCASSVIKQSNYYGTEHFVPAFRHLIAFYPPQIQLPLNDWEEVLQPLFDVQNSFLSINPSQKHEICEHCAIPAIVDDLMLHLMILRATPRSTPPLPQRHHQVLERAETAIEVDEGQLEEHFLTRTRVKNLQLKNIDDCLSSLLAGLQRIKVQEPEAIVVAIGLLDDLLQFDSAKTALRINSTSDAQDLIDFIFYLGSNKRLLRYCNRNTGRNATLLALEISERVPILPRSVLLNAEDFGIDDTSDISLSGEIKLHEYQGKAVRIKRFSSSCGDVRPMCKGILISVILLHDNIAASIGVCEDSQSWDLYVFPNPENGTLIEWLCRSARSAAQITSCMLDIAKGLQFLHSVGVLLNESITEDDIVMDSESHAKLLVSGLYSPNWGATASNEVHDFGDLFYSMYPNIDSAPDTRTEIQSRPYESGVLRLIDRCSNGDLNSIDDVVAEMESWKLHEC